MIILSVGYNTGFRFNNNKPCRYTVGATSPLPSLGLENLGDHDPLGEQGLENMTMTAALGIKFGEYYPPPINPPAETTEHTRAWHVKPRKSDSLTGRRTIIKALAKEARMTGKLVQSVEQRSAQNAQRSAHNAKQASLPELGFLHRGWNLVNFRAFTVCRSREHSDWKHRRPTMQC